MAIICPPFRFSLVAALLATGAQAQTPATLDPVTVTGRSEGAADVSGWGDVPLSKAPFQASVVSGTQLRDRGAQRLADLTRIDPAVSDAYNSEGYWDFLAVRGFVLDNRFNYRRDGLPINAETSIPLDNKERIELLKGTSGMQAGTSAPGGLVNYVVKRPAASAQRSAQFAWRQPGSLLGAVDLGQRFGEGQAFGVRLNAAYERLDPALRDARGHRNLLALAGDWRLSPDTLVEAEVETSHRSQRSQPGFSMLGPNVPAPGDPRINLNNQPWSQPVVMDGNTGSLRVTRTLARGWRLTGHAATQRLTTDDRLAFPFGCSAEGNFDRYCSDGTFDLYDYRSENEHRRMDAAEIAVHGELQTGELRHAFSGGVLRSRVRNRFQDYASYFSADPGNVQGTPVAEPTPDPTGIYANTNRDERSTEFFARDAVRIGEHLTAWLGLRHTRLQRESVLTNGGEPTAYRQSMTTPWLAASHALGEDQLVYASWGRGTESEVVPNRQRYTNKGQALPALKSRQIELGLKGSSQAFTWGLAWFDTERPVWRDIGPDCFTDTPGVTSCTRQPDGSARHRGLELSAGWHSGAWSFQGGLQALHARRNGSMDPALDGKRPINVPAQSIRLQARHDLLAVPGLQLQADAMAESNRMVLEDNSARIPGYGRLDLSARYEERRGAGALIWRAGIDNLLNRRAWKESPYQFGHVYLFPMAPRTLRLSVEAAL